MPNDPEKPIESLLRDYAKKRDAQAGGPFELHPATRRLLQGEVTRTYGHPRPARKPWAWITSWPRLAWALGLMVILAFAARVLLPENEKGFTLVENRPGEPARSDLAYQGDTEQSPPAAAADFASNTLADLAVPRPQADKDRSLNAESEGNRPGDIALATAPATRPLPTTRAAPTRSEPVAPAATAPGESFARRYGLPSRSAADPAALPAPAAAPAARVPGSEAKREEATAGAVKSNANLAAASREQPAAASARAVRATDAGGPLPAVKVGRLLFADSKRGAPALSTNSVAQPSLRLSPKNAEQTLTAKAQPGPNVLARFTFEQTGQQVRLVDADGSVYLGSVIAASPPPPVTAQRSRTPSTSARRSEAQLDYFGSSVTSVSFTVSGTNRTLNRPVWFTGTLSPGTNTPVGTQFGVAYAEAQAAPLVVPAHGLRVLGRLKLGAEEIPVEAVAAPR